MASKICFLLAHPDDEYFIYSYMKRVGRRADKVICIYTTDAAPQKFNATRRFEESRRVLSHAGLRPNAIYTPGVDLEVPDLAAYKHLERLLPVIVKICREHDINALVLPTWEGGHVDHDATHLLGQAVARSLPYLQSLTEFSLYNAYQRPKGFFRVMTLIPGAGPIQEHNLTCAEAWEHFWQVGCYPSQWKTFIGLGPAVFLRLVLLRQEKTRTYARSEVNYLDRPHPGPLLYETRFKVPYDSFQREIRPFVEKHIEKSVA